MTLRALLLALAVFGSTQTLSAQERARVYDKSEFTPTAFHEVVYRMMEICSGVDGKFEDIRWYTAKIILVEGSGAQWIGAWTKRADSELSEIILDREFVFDGNTVSHEALHDLYDGSAPMDIASRCVLDWSRLTYIRREEGE